MELIDILTADGKPTGTTKPKSEVHRDGDWHRCAHLWIVVPDGRLVLQRRSETKENWPGLWDISVAGHINAGEQPVDAVVREAAEELGLNVRPAELTHIGTLQYAATLNDGAYIENEFHEVFIARRDIDLTTLTLDPAEVAEVRLVAPEELPHYEVVPHPQEYELLFDALARIRRIEN